MDPRTPLLALVVAACSPFTAQSGPSSPYAPPAAPANPCNVDPEAAVCQTDRDRDSVPDSRDGCPDTAGPASGCPDADGDVIADASDRCPTAKESPNGFEDDDGCPDASPAEDPALTHPFVLEELPAGSSKLDGTVRLALDDYAITLRKVAGLRLRISGHTDLQEAASEAARRKLAQRRAEAVRDYLVKKWGVDAARIEVLGVGAGEPAADNGGAGGRAKNRRVEIVAAPT